MANLMEWVPKFTRFVILLTSIISSRYITYPFFHQLFNYEEFLILMSELHVRKKTFSFFIFKQKIVTSFWWYPVHSLLWRWCFSSISFTHSWFYLNKWINKPTQKIFIPFQYGVLQRQRYCSKKVNFYFNRYQFCPLQTTFHTHDVNKVIEIQTDHFRTSYVELKDTFIMKSLLFFCVLN